MKKITGTQKIGAIIIIVSIWLGYKGFSDNNNLLVLIFVFSFYAGLGLLIDRSLKNVTNLTELILKAFLTGLVLSVIVGIIIASIGALIDFYEKPKEASVALLILFAPMIVVYLIYFFFSRGKSK